MTACPQCDHGAVYACLVAGCPGAPAPGRMGGWPPDDPGKISTNLSAFMYDAETAINRPEEGTSDMTITQTPTVHRSVLDALQKQGVKYSDLTDEQKARAQAAPEKGFDGKMLVAHVVDGKSFDEVQQEGDAAQKAAKKAAPRKSAAAKSNGSASTASKYTQDVRDAVKRANEIRGKSHGAGPKQHATVREVVRKSLSLSATKNPTVDQIVQASGAGSLAKLTKIANGSAGREDLKALQPLAKLMGDDGWCKGRHLAAALVAWAEQIKASAK